MNVIQDQSHLIKVCQEYVHLCWIPANAWGVCLGCADIRMASAIVFGSYPDACMEAFVEECSQGTDAVRQQASDKCSFHLLWCHTIKWLSGECMILLLKRAAKAWSCVHVPHQKCVKSFVSVDCRLYTMLESSRYDILRICVMVLDLPTDISICPRLLMLTCWCWLRRVLCLVSKRMSNFAYSTRGVSHHIGKHD